MKTAVAIREALLGLADIEELQNYLRPECLALAQAGYVVSHFQQELEGLSTQAELIDLCNRLPDILQDDERSHLSEPDSLTAIRAARPDGPRAVDPQLEAAELLDRIHGGWLGRVAGCVLGKPVEPWGYWGKIRDYLKLANSYPLSNYIPRLEVQPEEYQFGGGGEGTLLGEINGAPEDDDTDYSVLALHMLEAHGLDLTTADVAAEWLDHLAYTRIWTAERATYRNLILGAAPGEAARLLNPEREYIGARIRADVFGLVAPGSPELAADMASRDASLSHTRNGVYSAMFMAACIAWAFVCKDTEEIVRVGLSEIPADCRLARTTQAVLNQYRRTEDWREAYEGLLPEMAAYPPVHAINNHAWLVLALLYGKGDFESTICTAVQCGFDTDCNGANAGAVLGVMVGAKALPHRWIDPLDDRLRSSVAQFGELRIADLARRTTDLARHYLSSNSTDPNPKERI